MTGKMYLEVVQTYVCASNNGAIRIDSTTVVIREHESGLLTP